MIWEDLKFRKNSLEGFHYSSIYSYRKNKMQMKISMERRWNDMDRRKSKYSEKEIFPTANFSTTDFA